MRKLKLLLVIFAVVMSTTAFANSEKFTDPDAVTLQIEKLVKAKETSLGKDFSVTIFFSISENNRIQSLSVASPDEVINQLLLKELSGQELSGDQWLKGKIYELTVNIR